MRGPRPLPEAISAPAARPDLVAIQLDGGVSAHPFDFFFIFIFFSFLEQALFVSSFTFTETVGTVTPRSPGHGTPFPRLSAPRTCVARLPSPSSTRQAVASEAVACRPVSAPGPRLAHRVAFSRHLSSGSSRRGPRASLVSGDGGSLEGDQRGPLLISRSFLKCKLCVRTMPFTPQ